MSPLSVWRPVVVALGSNLGARDEHLRHGLERLGEQLADLRVSRVHETPPVGASTQSWFLNAVAVGRAAETPQVLLARLLAIEAERGRTRPFPRAPRTLDLDLILVGELVVNMPDLVLPHPRFRERRFVLAPLVEVAPEVVDPVTGKTARELLAALPH